jgi:hypothetical protein
MLIKRAPLFFCFVLGGILLDGYWTWYSFHFWAACSASENSVPPSLVMFTALSLVPATGSLILRSSRVYVFICLVVWLSHIVFQIDLTTEVARFERAAGVNCYRDIGASLVVSLYFTGMFSAAITAVTLAFGVIWLVRKWLRRPAAHRRVGKA